MILCFELQKLIFVCGQAVRQTAVEAAKTAGKPEEATCLGALAVAHFFEKEKKAALETKAAAEKEAADADAARKQLAAAKKEAAAAAKKEAAAAAKKSPAFVEQKFRADAAKAATKAEKFTADAAKFIAAKTNFDELLLIETDCLIKAELTKQRKYALNSRAKKMMQVKMGPEAFKRKIGMYPSNTAAARTGATKRFKSRHG